MLTMLVPGSTWERGTNGKKSIVLHITNQNLNEKVAAKNPSQVVFMTEEKAVLSQSIEQFLASRKFYSMDARIEQLINEVLAEEDEAIEEPEIDAIIIEDDEEVKFEQETEISSNVSEQPAVQHLLSINVGPHEIANLLTNSFVSYSESPFYNGDTLHKLVFRLGNGLTLDNLRSAFFIKDPNAIQKFVIQSAYEATMVDVDSYVDTLLEAANYGAFGAVHLLSAGAFRTTEESIDDVEIDVSEDDDIQVDMNVSADYETITTVDVTEHSIPVVHAQVINHQPANMLRVNAI